MTKCWNVASDNLSVTVYEGGEAGLLGKHYPLLQKSWVGNDNNVTITLAAPFKLAAILNPNRPVLLMKIRFEGQSPP